MARFAHKHTSSFSAKKLVFFILCAGLLVAALTADFLWASSSAYLSTASNWALEKTGIPNQNTKTAVRVSPLEHSALLIRF